MWKEAAEEGPSMYGVFGEMEERISPSSTRRWGMEAAMMDAAISAMPQI